MGSAEEFADETVEFAADYYGTGFPNPERRGCPESGVLLGIVGNRTLPAEDVREHLLSCSECFNEFKALRAQNASSLAPKKKAFAASVSSIVGISFLMGVAATTIAVIIGLFIFSPSDSATGRSSGNDVPPVIAAANRTDGPVAPSAQREAEAGSSMNRIPRAVGAAMSTFTFDLARLAVSRNSSDYSTVTRLPAEKVVLKMNLRPGSPSGRYGLALFDEFGKSVSGLLPIKSNGKTISAVVDFARYSGPMRLCVSHGDEVPDCVPLDVVPPPKK